MTNILITYKALLRLSVQQLFYQNNICRQYQTEPELDMLIVPTENCLNVLKRMDLIFKNTDTHGGFIVLGRVSDKNAIDNDVLRFPFRKEDALSFLMILKNPEVINFDDLPLQSPNDVIYYFSNEITDNTATRNSLHITKGEAGVNGAEDIIRKASANYRFHHLTAVLPGTVKVKHVLSGQTVPPVLLATQNGQSDLAFNLAALPTGKCQLLINNLPADEFYYLGKYFAEPVFGVIELLLSPTLAANYRIIEPDRSLTPERPLYIIRFNNRPTFWRYTIQLQNNSPLYLEMAALSPADKADFINNLNIETNDTTITFNRATATDTSFLFVSGDPIFLQEKYFSSTSVTHDILILTLKKYIGDVAREVAVKANLPYPSTGTLDASTLPQVYSDIFLTI